MTSLYNLIRRGDFKEAPIEKSMALTIADEIASATVFQIDNVASYMIGLRHGRLNVKDWIAVEDFPNCAPVLDDMWFEANLLPLADDRFRPDKVACLIHAHHWEDVTKVHNVLSEIGLDDPGEIKWSLEITTWMAWRGLKTVVGPWTRIMIFIGPDGRIVSGPDAPRTLVNFVLDNPKHPIGDKQQENVVWISMEQCVYPALMALSFMHCKNVDVVAIDPPPKLNRAYQRRHGTPLTRYHTLIIEPMKRVLKDEGKAEVTGLKLALHICRGHFATYGQNGKGLLFGKHAGTFWISPHVRGSAEKGEVVKRYRVMSPEVSAR